MQYSLRSLIILMTGVAIACFVLFVLPEPLSSLVLGCCYLLASTAVLSLLIYGDGDIRAFAVGCILPLTWYWLMFGTRGLMPRSSFDPGYSLVTGVVTLVSGFVSVGVRRWCAKRHSAAPTPREEVADRDTEDHSE